MKTFQKALSIHSEDRDLLKYPNASKFAFELPVEYKNVLALRLTDISLPYLYTFSESKNNLTFSIQRYTNTVPSTPVDILPIKITISPGNYVISQMVTELKAAIDKALGTNTIQVNFDNVRNTIVFGSDDILSLSFFNQPIASHLGFNQTDINKSISLTEYNASPYVNHVTFTPAIVCVLEAPYPYNLQGDPFIYMELDLYNNIDELTPYTIQNKGTSKHNLAFAKIPTRLFGVAETVYVSKELYLSNVFYSDPPLERVQKFQCKFRYHDGTLVDFGVSKFSFTIEITMLIYPNYCPWD